MEWLRGLFGDVFGLQISEGALVNPFRRARERVAKQTLTVPERAESSRAKSVPERVMPGRGQSCGRRTCVVIRFASCDLDHIVPDTQPVHFSGTFVCT